MQLKAHALKYQSIFPQCKQNNKMEHIFEYQWVITHDYKSTSIPSFLYFKYIPCFEIVESVYAYILNLYNLCILIFQNEQYFTMRLKNCW